MADWYVHKYDGPPLGPWSTEHIADAILRGELSHEIWVAAPGGSRWLRALDVPNIAQRVEGVATRRRRESGFVVVGTTDYAATTMMVKEGEVELVPDDAPTERTLAPPAPPSSPTPPTTRPVADDTLESPARRRAGGR